VKPRHCCGCWEMSEALLRLKADGWRLKAEGWWLNLVIDEVASLVEEWRLGEAVHMSLHLRVSLLLRKRTANLTHKSSIYTS
jgi:hypothetical protein